jgi:hypothetical protein
MLRSLVLTVTVCGAALTQQTPERTLNHAITPAKVANSAQVSCRPLRVLPIAHRRSPARHFHGPRAQTTECEILREHPQLEFARALTPQNHPR